MSRTNVLRWGTRPSSSTPGGNARSDAKLAQALRRHVGDEVELMYDGSAGFDLPDAVYLGHALVDAGYFWYEEPMREFSVTAYKWLSQRVRAPC